MRIRPCIDLHQGQVRQIVGNSLRDGEVARTQVNFATERSAAEFARMYREDGLSGGHVIMLGPGNEAQARAALAADPDGLQIGGGITPENAGQWLAAGAAKVIVTSYLFVDGQFSRDRLAAMAAAVGPERLVLDLSCRRCGDDYRVAARRWQETTGMKLDGQTLRELSGYCSEFLVHAVEVEGQRSGIDETLVRLLAEICPTVVTYAGGVRSLADLSSIAGLGRGRVDATVGSALDIFGGDLPYRAVVEFDRRMI